MSERDPDFQEKVRAACNMTDAPEQGCTFPWCVCNDYPAPKKDAEAEVERRKAKPGANT